MDWRNKRVIIIGAARQGLALARYLVRHGARVVLNDRRTAAELGAAVASLSDLSVEWVLGSHPFEILNGADMLCLSGGVALDLPLVSEAFRRGIPLSNDSQVFLEAAPCKVIGITGSAGKTTTTTLVGRIASAAAASISTPLAPSRAWVGGNIGSPLIAMVDEMLPSDLAVMELSSFQLDIMTRSPQVAAVLNITPNHLDRHPSMEAYTAAKRRILDFQQPKDAAVLGREDPGAWVLREHVHSRLFSFGRDELPAGQPGTSMRGDLLVWCTGTSEVELMHRADIQLRGEHNLLNVLAACAIAGASGWSGEAMRVGVKDFRGVPHRLELVRVWKGASWYNDSIATAPERAMAAIHSFNEPLVLLVGGRDKNLPWKEFAELAGRRVDHLILFGEAAGKVEKALEAEQDLHPHTPVKYTLTRTGSLKEAVRAAAEIVEPGDIVLLSPGGTSFDEFRDFEDRGEAYRKWVMELL